MAGIYPINLLIYSFSSPYGGQPLTYATKSKLQALGVETRYIRTEAEGQQKLRIAEAERWTKGISSTKKKATEKTEDENLRLARELADKLNVSYNSDENVTEICSRIQQKLDTMRTEAEDDFDKNANVDYYQKKLDEIESFDLSKSQLASSMNLTANMNIAFHNLY